MRWLWKNLALIITLSSTAVAAIVWLANGTAGAAVAPVDKRVTALEAERVNDAKRLDDLCTDVRYIRRRIDEMADRGER